MSLFSQLSSFLTIFYPLKPHNAGSIMPWTLKKVQNQSMPLILYLLNEPVFFLITLHPGSSLIVSYKPVIKLFLKWIPFSVYEIILSWRQSESQEGIGSEVAAFPTTPDAVPKMDLSIYYHAGVVMLHKGSYSFFFPCEGPLPGWHGGRIQRNHRFRGMGSQREQRSFWHTTFIESLVCYTFILTTDAGNGVALRCISLPAFFAVKGCSQEAA